MRTLATLNTDDGARTVHVGSLGDRWPAWAMRETCRSHST
jgi:hypothetical protein